MVVDGTLVYGSETIRYEVRFLASRRTLSIEVHPDSRVLVRAPLGCPEALIVERYAPRTGDFQAAWSVDARLGAAEAAAGDSAALIW